jgi:hypothetical protein
MKPSALILYVGIFATLFLADAQSQPAIAQVCTTTGGVTTFHVYVLKSGFTPDIYYNPSPTSAKPSYSPPTTDGTISISGSAMAADLSNAFLQAPPFFQQQLCSLDGVYINTTGCVNFGALNICVDSSGNPLSNAQVAALATVNSWGFREQPRQFAPNTAPPLGHYGRYISISAAPWGSAMSTSPNYAPRYSGYEKSLLQQLLSWTSNPPSYHAYPVDAQEHQI